MPDPSHEAEQALALALAEAQHQRSSILRQAQDKPWARPTCSSRWLDRIPHLGYNQVCPTVRGYG